MQKSTAGGRKCGQLFSVERGGRRGTRGLIYEISYKGKTTFYEELEVALNAGEVELLDDVKVQEQLLTLVLRGAKVDHQPGDHDDHANAVAGCVWLMRTALRYQDDVKFVTPL